MKRVKRGVVDRFLRKNPLASASVVAQETGCHLTTVYIARKRLGLPTRVSDRALPPPLPKEEYIKQRDAFMAIGISLEQHDEELLKLKDKLEFAKISASALAVFVVLSALMAFVIFK